MTARLPGGPRLFFTRLRTFVGGVAGLGRRGEFSHSSPAWRAVRLAALERDGWICQIRGPRCTYAATEGDHIVPLRHGGAWFDLDNIRASCKPCNAGRMMREAAGGADPVVVRRPSREW